LLCYVVVCGWIICTWCRPVGTWMAILCLFWHLWRWSGGVIWSAYSKESYRFISIVSRDVDTHTHTLNALPLPLFFTRVSQYQKSKPIWILLKQETVSGSGISWAICKSAPRSRQITTPVLHHSIFYRPDGLPAAQPTASKHWRQ